MRRTGSIIGLLLGAAAMLTLGARYYDRGMVAYWGDSTLTNLWPGQVYFNTSNTTLYVGNASSNPVVVGSAAWSNNVTGSVTNGLADTNFVNNAVAPLVSTNDNRDVSFSNVVVRGSLTLNNTTWDDLRIPMSTARAGVTVPNYSVFTNGVYTWHFIDGTQNDTLYFETQLPHNYKHGSDLRPHLHWAVKTASTNAVVWEFEYAIASIYSNFPASSIMTVTGALDNIAYKHHLTSFGTISGAGIRASAVMVGRLTRLGNDGGDTYTGDACPLSLDIHYQQDKVMGSDDEIPGP